MRSLFFGTSDFAVPSLRVMAAGTELFGVVTQPDRRAGRGQRVVPSPVKSAALELGLDVLQPQNLRDFAASIAGTNFDLFALASYGRILPASLLALPRLGSLNVHPSLLPKYRGATPIQNAIRNGDEQTGVTVMLMDAGLDTGDIVASAPISIAPTETYGELHDRLAEAGAQLLARSIDLAAAGTLRASPQTGEATLTRPIGKDDLILDWSLAPEHIVDFVRAYSPAPAARANIDGESVKILRAHVDAAGDLVIDELIAPNRGRMSGAAYRQSRSTIS